MYFTHINFDFSFCSNNRTPFVTSHPLQNVFKLCTYLSTNLVTRTNFFNELNLPQPITFPTPTSLPQELTLILNQSPCFFFPVYLHFLPQELLPWPDLFPVQQKCWSVPPQRTTFQFTNRTFLRTNICWIQRCRYKTPIFYNNIFPYCLYPILDPNLPFFTPLPNLPQRNLRIRLTKNLLYRSLFLHCQLH